VTVRAPVISRNPSTVITTVTVSSNAPTAQTQSVKTAPFHSAYWAAI
jgi:hypothetical protein